MVSVRGRATGTGAGVCTFGAGGRVVGVTGCGAGTVAAGGATDVPLPPPPPPRAVPGCWNSTGCRNAVATGTPRRLAGAKRSFAEPASAAESRAG
jgi:hypothetical protein